MTLRTLNLKELAAETERSYRTIRTWVKERGLPARYINGKPYVLYEDYLRWFRDQDSIDSDAERWLERRYRR